MNPHHNNPYISSRRYRPDGPWWDTFAKGGRVAYLVFNGPDLLAEVKNEQQAANVVEAIENN